MVGSMLCPELQRQKSTPGGSHDVFSDMTFPADKRLGVKKVAAGNTVTIKSCFTSADELYSAPCGVVDGLYIQF